MTFSGEQGQQINFKPIFEIKHIKCIKDVLGFL
jgi:hypothetical protein